MTIADRTNHLLPNPHRARVGIGQGAPTRVDFEPFSVEPDENTIPGLNLVFPTFRPISGSFRRLRVPSTSPPALVGQSCWYSLVNVTATPQPPIGQELLLVGERVELLSADVEGTGGNIAWGDDLGLRAALIIGTNLPIGAAGTWNVAQSFLPGILPLGVVGGLYNIENDQHYLWSSFLPTGRLFTAGAATANKIIHGEDYAPFIRRITYGTSIGAAFVIDSAPYEAARLAGGGGGFFQGYVGVRMRLGLTKTETTFS